MHPYKLRQKVTAISFGSGENSENTHLKIVAPWIVDFSEDPIEIQLASEEAVLMFLDSEAAHVEFASAGELVARARGLCLSGHIQELQTHEDELMFRVLKLEKDFARVHSENKIQNERLARLLAEQLEDKEALIDLRLENAALVNQIEEQALQIEGLGTKVDQQAASLAAVDEAAQVVAMAHQQEKGELLLKIQQLEELIDGSGEANALLPAPNFGTSGGFEAVGEVATSIVAEAATSGEAVSGEAVIEVSSDDLPPPPPEAPAAAAELDLNGEAAQV